MVLFLKDTTGPEPTPEPLKAFDRKENVKHVEELPSLQSLPAAPQAAAATADEPTEFSKKLDKALKFERGKHSNFIAKTLASLVGWSYSDYDTFKDMVADTIGPNVETMMIQIKNEPMLVEATAQLIRTNDKKVIFVIFRGTEMTNLPNWMTDAEAKKSVISVKDNNKKKLVKVHAGFKTNLEKVWFGKKGILMHLMNPEMIRKDYNYDTKGFNKKTPHPGSHNKQYMKYVKEEHDKLEAIYMGGHSLGGAMAFLAGLYLGAVEKDLDITCPYLDPIEPADLFLKLRGVYTYGAPMAVDDHGRDLCQRICGDVTLRHVYYNDIFPHLPPLSTGSFDHVGKEYRYHPRQPSHGWKKRDDRGLSFKKGRCTQVASIVVTGLFGAIDGILDNINWLNFFRGDYYKWKYIGFFSRGYLKMPWSFLDHSPLGYISTLNVDELHDDESLDTAGDDDGKNSTSRGGLVGNELLDTADDI